MTPCTRNQTEPDGSVVEGRVLDSWMFSLISGLLSSLSAIDCSILFE
jgi:hypothetical protein